MPEATFEPILSDPVSRYARIAPEAAPKPKRLGRLREALRSRHYSRRTEQTYCHWFKRFIHFHNLRHPADMAEPEINAYLTHLAVKEEVSVSTQNQALSALLFLYRYVLEREIGDLGDGIRARKPCHLPAGMTREEVKAEDALRKGIGEAHRRYTRRVNFREGWRGHLWQGRFSSFPLDEKYLFVAIRYVERNPVRAGVVKKPWEYPWSSASAHLAGRDDLLVKVFPLAQVVGDWKEFLSKGDEEEEIKEIRRHERTGRPLGKDGFVLGLEKALGRTLRYQKSGPKGKKKQ